MAEVSLGVEIGGTFTDLVAYGPTGLQTVKVPSTPHAPEQGATMAVQAAFPDLAAVATVVHGSTIATNAVLERRGDRVGLLVTAGFGDLLELQRQDRTDTTVLKYRKPQALVPRDDVFEVSERIAADGTVVQELDNTTVEAAFDALAAAGIETVAVCLLHAFRNPAHELAIADLAAQRYPDLIVVLSHQVSPEPREYERASTTVLDGYVRRAVDGYLGRLEQALAGNGFSGDVHVMQSNGGAMPGELVRRNAIRMLLSGPAGGISAALAVGRELGLADLLTFDMGGTSSDICLIRGGRAEIRHDSAIDHLPIRVPMLDIVTVGSGGGSIATVDHGGMLHVGPRSAGSTPGPACYGRGGPQATITDANVVVGLIRPERFLGGGMQLDVEAAEHACAEVGAKLGTDAVGGAAAILRVAGTDIAGALRLASTERGVDPSDFWLLTYGGAGAQHAVPLAEELGLKGVVVPVVPGLFSAYGLLIADLSRDWSAPVLAALDTVDRESLTRITEDLRSQAESEFARAGVDLAALQFTRTLSLRYVGQAFDLEIEADGGLLPDLAVVRKAFDDEHRLRYGHASEEAAVEIVTLRLTATLPRGSRPAALAESDTPIAARVLLDRPHLDAAGPVAFYDRRAATEPVAGPAVIEEHSSTTWIPRGWTASPTDGGHLLITRSAS